MKSLISDFEDFLFSLRRCSKCLLPETFPGIYFDDEGVCNYCRNYERVKVFGEEALLRSLEKYRGKGKKYDCIVAISGGRDSAFVLHQIVRKYNMRTLALTVDSGFITEEGHRNIRAITEALGVDHVYLRDDEHIRASWRNLKIMFHAWLKKPSINMIVPALNAADKTMNLQIYRYARENGIPLVIGGNNIGNCSFEQEHFKTGYMGVFPDERGNYAMFDKVKLTTFFAWEFLKNPGHYHWSVIQSYVSGALVYFFESMLKPPEVDTLGFYDYIYWNENEILSTITKIGWKGAGDTTATWRIDDMMYPLIDYIYLRLVGFNEFDEFYSKLIREGQISREEALKRCLLDRIPRPSILFYLLERLGVSKGELDEVLDKYRTQLLPKILKKA
ncbi:hypothetical protein DRO49_00800 [Candidatus Bathyarchaeota archaeon]|nr:MAG: hypothetical protein DRO49_00800 [Candidatus Bathyarchaeota archaeon]